MMKIIIYTTKYCGYCLRAKRLLDQKGYAYEEIALDGDPNLRASLSKSLHGYSSVPMIFIDDRFIGGCDELFQLDQKGRL